jgi:hypothetical protein
VQFARVHGAQCAYGAAPCRTSKCSTLMPRSGPGLRIACPRSLLTRKSDGGMARVPFLDFEYILI